MKRLPLMFFLFLLPALCQAQTPQRTDRLKTTPSFAVRSNLLYDATTSMDLGVEFKVGKKLTLEVPATYNPWTWNDNKKFKFILAQPELRRWFCEPFNGHFLGLHAHYAFYNVGGVGSDHMKKYRYEGDLWGGGISYGYQFYLAPRWGLELNVGAGYAYLDYKKFDCEDCGDFRGREYKHYWGITRLGVKLVFYIK